MLADTDWHPHVTAIIRVERDVYTRNAKTGLLRHSSETAFYVSNTPVTAARAAKAVRAHWRIENTSHYSRDVTLGEDRSRIRTNPSVFARLRSLPLTSSRPTRPTRSAGTATAPVSQASRTCSHSPPFINVEQPCPAHEGAAAVSGPFSSNLTTQDIDMNQHQNASYAQSQLRHAMPTCDQRIRTEWRNRGITPGSSGCFGLSNAGEYDSLVACRHWPVCPICHVLSWKLCWWSCWASWLI